MSTDGNRILSLDVYAIAQHSDISRKMIMIKCKFSTCDIGCCIFIIQAIIV